MRWIIGDIHGMIRPLTTVVAGVLRQDPQARFIFAGDYVNRGGDSNAVIEYLIALPNASFVRGNHDDIFDQVLHDEHYAENATRGSRPAAFQWFMKYGLDATFMSYGAGIAHLRKLAQNPDVAALQRLVEWIPSAHRQFVRNLPPVYEDDDLFVVHGKWDPDEFAENPGIRERLDQGQHHRHRLLWGRYTDDELFRVKAWRRIGYFGHTPVNNYAAAFRLGTLRREPMMLPIRANKMVLLDTAAALGVDGRLTAYCHETGNIVQANHFGVPL